MVDARGLKNPSGFNARAGSNPAPGTSVSDRSGDPASGDALTQKNRGEIDSPRGDVPLSNVAGAPGLPITVGN